MLLASDSTLQPDALVMPDLRRRFPSDATVCPRLFVPKSKDCGERELKRGSLFVPSPNCVSLGRWNAQAAGFPVRPEGLI